VIPVGQRIALILAPGEMNADTSLQPGPAPASTSKSDSPPQPAIVTPVAARLAAEHNLDITQIKPNGGQIRKEDVLAFLKKDEGGRMKDEFYPIQHSAFIIHPSRILASPKARRLAKESGFDLSTISGSGPDGAVLVADLSVKFPSPPGRWARGEGEVSRIWRIMVERISQSWTTIPHFYLIREVNASRLIAWREKVKNSSAEKITYTDLLVRLTAVALQKYPRLNASWQSEKIILNPEINIGLAVAVDDGLIVPVIHHADELNLIQIASQRQGIVDRAKAGKLSLDDLSGGTFTISNLGMYGVDAFSAIVNPPQAAILAVSRIADRVVPLNGAPAIQPMMTLSLSCDHRVVNGTHAAQFLQALADLIEEPLQLLN
jgi:pyruvate dehydrogenase E2 component (dihydrolipoamide acetyltransferase)